MRAGVACARRCGTRGGERARRQERGCRKLRAYLSICSRVRERRIGGRRSAIIAGVGVGAVVLLGLIGVAIGRPIATAAAQSPPPPAADVVAPRLTGLGLIPRRVRRTVGARLRFTLSEPARVTGEILRRTRGVRSRGGRCLPRRAGRRGSSCVRRARAGSLPAVDAALGANRARLGVRRLRPGAYTLVLTPTDTAGNAGEPRSLRFHVLA